MGSASEVSVVGDLDAELEEVEAGAWHTTLDLEAGDYAYQLEVDGARQADPFSHLVTADGRSLLRVEDCSVPVIDVETAAASAAGGLVIEASFLRSRARLDTATATFLDGTPLELEISGNDLEIQATGLKTGKHTVVIEASDRSGSTATVRVPLWVEDEPFSWEGAVIYHLMIDRFASADGELVHGDDPLSRFGGDLHGVLDALEAGWFEELGASALWLSPVYDNPDAGYHGYWPLSIDAVEPDFGGEEAFEAVVEAAHKRGMRVILDVVPNHVYEDHPYRERADWFHENPDCICGDYTCPWDAWIETCWFDTFLPDLALDKPEVAQTVAADTVAWATRYDLDGFRVDAVPMMSRPAVRELTWAVRKELGEDFYLLGETFTGEGGYDDIGTNLGPFGLDGQFEFPNLWALRSFIAHESGNAGELDRVLAESEARWQGSESVMAPFIGNHDMERFLTTAGGSEQKLIMAHALAFSLPGAPVLYYGDDVGLEGGDDPDSRRPMRFSEGWILERVRRLGQARACSPSLKTGTRRTLIAEGAHFAMVREGGSPAVLVLNASAEPAVIELPYVGATSWFDAIEQEPLSGHDISMEPWSARLLLDSNSPCAGSAP